jgi:uncharacterized membrane protein
MPSWTEAARVPATAPGAGAASGRELAARFAEKWGLVALYIFTVSAVLGYGIFGQHPARVAAMPSWAAEFYGWSFSFFALGHVWLAMVVLAAVLWLRAGTKWLVAFALSYGISLSSELAGTTWGIPFGEYRYSQLLAPMWLDRVPWVIPMSWFFMALPSYALAALAVRSAWGRIAVGSLILLAWDLALDPAMSYATRYWFWGDSGPYYGMPWLNLFGWYVTGVVLMGVFVWQRAERWTDRITPRWWAAFYGANLILPLGMCVAAGLWLAVVATVVVLGITWLVLQRAAAAEGETA